MTIIERSIINLYDGEDYRRAAHKHGMAETLALLVGDPQVRYSGRPGGALLRLARTVEAEMACIGLPILPVPVTEGMTRVHIAQRLRRARQSAGS